MAAEYYRQSWKAGLQKQAVDLILLHFGTKKPSCTYMHVHIGVLADCIGYFHTDTNIIGICKYI